MLTITEQIPDFDTYEEYLGYRRETCLFFDIETTGLSSASAIVFLIGAVSRHNGRWQLTQWIAQCPEDEPMLLQAFFDAAAKCDTLIHFNGTTFDLPFLRERAKRIGGTLSSKSGESAEHPGYDGISTPGSFLERKKSLDLYQKFRPLKNLLHLERMNQTSLEQFLGWPRKDRLTGKHMISLFRKYAASQEPLLCDLLLLHNHDDLVGMTNLLRLSAYAMLFEGQFASVSASVSQNQLELHLGLKAILPGELSLTVPRPLSPNRHRPETAEMPNTSSETGLCREATLYQGTASCRENALCRETSSCRETAPCREAALPYALTASDTQAVLRISGFCGELRHFFPNYKDYYYLPLEDQAIHKSVAAFVDREYRIPAEPANCCIKKSGLFFPQAEEIFSPAFKPFYQSKELFFICPDQGAEALDQQELASYAASLLRLFAKHAV